MPSSGLGASGGAGGDQQSPPVPLRNGISVQVNLKKAMASCAQTGRPKTVTWVRAVCVVWLCGWRVTGAEADDGAEDGAVPGHVAEADGRAARNHRCKAAGRGDVYPGTNAPTGQHKCRRRSECASHAAWLDCAGECRICGCSSLRAPPLLCVLV